ARAKRLSAGPGCGDSPPCRSAKTCALRLRCRRSSLRELPGKHPPRFNPAEETSRLLHILRLVLPILLAAWVFRQVRKPSGCLGRRVVRAMNLSHATMADWGLQQVRVPKNAAILDVGCGGGGAGGGVAGLAAWGNGIWVE